MNTSKLLSLLVLTIGLSSCMGRSSSSIQDARQGNLQSIRDQNITHLYFVPFDTSTVKLNGDHGDDKTAAENKSKWFAHLFLGAIDQIHDTKSTTSPVLVEVVPQTYETWLSNKTKKPFQYQNKAPANSFVVTGKYIESKNVSGGSRAMLGIMVGKSYTRAAVEIKKGKELIYAGTIDGKYLGGGYSWGYETLGANEGLGKEIIAIIQSLQSGKKKEAI